MDQPVPNAPLLSVVHVVVYLRVFAQDVWVDTSDLVLVPRALLLQAVYVISLLQVYALSVCLDTFTMHLPVVRALQNAQLVRERARINVSDVK